MTDSPRLSYTSSREIPTLFYTIKPEKATPFGWNLSMALIESTPWWPIKRFH